MSQAIMPKFGNTGNMKPPPVAHASAGLAEITNAEALLLAAWREERWDVIQRMVNMRSELQLVFTDPLFDDVEG